MLRDQQKPAHSLAGATSIEQTRQTDPQIALDGLGSGET
jgi:hypothetical protein